MQRPRLLDLFCGAGGSAVGYHRAGFDVVGVDIVPQPNYPYEFVQADAIWALRQLVYGHSIADAHLSDFAAIHASPPCQFYAGLSDSSKHWRSIPVVRDLLEQTGLPYVIENIADAAWDMREPVRLCGSMFGLHVRRHRMFETTLPFFMQPRCQHVAQGEIRAYYGKPGWAAWTPKGANVQKKGRRPLLRGSVELAPADMGIDWMTWDELREAIPPAYCEFIGTQLLSWLRRDAGALDGSSPEHISGTFASPDLDSRSRRTNALEGSASSERSHLAASEAISVSSPRQEQARDALD